MIDMFLVVGRDKKEIKVLDTEDNVIDVFSLAEFDSVLEKGYHIIGYVKNDFHPSVVQFKNLFICAGGYYVGEGSNNLLWMKFQCFEFYGSFSVADKQGTYTSFESLVSSGVVQSSLQYILLFLYFKQSTIRDFGTALAQCLSEQYYTEITDIVNKIQYHDCNDIRYYYDDRVVMKCPLSYLGSISKVVKFNSKASMLGKSMKMSPDGTIKVLGHRDNVRLDSPSIYHLVGNFNEMIVDECVKNFSSSSMVQIEHLTINSLSCLEDYLDGNGVYSPYVVVDTAYLENILEYGLASKLNKKKLNFTGVVDIDSILDKGYALTKSMLYAFGTDLSPFIKLDISQFNCESLKDLSKDDSLAPALIKYTLGSLGIVLGHYTTKVGLNNIINKLEREYKSGTFNDIIDSITSLRNFELDLSYTGVALCFNSSYKKDGYLVQLYSFSLHKFAMRRFKQFMSLLQQNTIDSGFCYNFAIEKAEGVKTESVQHLIDEFMKGND